MMGESLIKVAVLDDYQEAACKMADWGLLRDKVEVIFYQDHVSGIDELVERLKGFEIISIMRERTPFSRDLMSRLPNLRLLITTGMQNASIDIEVATELGIMVCGTNGPMTKDHLIDMSDVVELTWGLIICLARRIPQEDTAVRESRWQTSIGVNLNGKTLGILGLGNLGAKVANVGRAFGLHIVAWSQNLTKEVASRYGAALADKEELFSESDIISIHLKLSDRTRGMVGKKELEMMKHTAFLINTSRGPIVDEKALIDALANRVIKGAGLDVFEQEPLPDDHPFLSMDNVVLTPHIGYVSENTYKVFFKDIIEDILAYLGNRPVRVLNPTVHWKPAI